MAGVEPVASTNDSRVVGPWLAIAFVRRRSPLRRCSLVTFRAHPPALMITRCRSGAARGHAVTA